MNPIHTVHSAAAYAPVYTFEPMVLLWLALLFLVIGGTLLVAGWARARHHTSWSEQTGRRPVLRLLEDTRLQRRLGAGVLAAALLAGVGSFTFHQFADRNLRENIMAKYDVVAVEEISGRGDGFTADLHWADGTVDRGELIHLATDDEPYLGAFRVDVEEQG